MILALSAGRDAPGELRARLALDESGQRKLLRAERTGVGELAVLCTCHRTELYATADGAPAEALHAVAALLPELRASDQHDMRFMEGSEAVEHLFRVTCGLDSLVIGESQVLGQVRRALVIAQEEGAAGPVLVNLLGRAMRLGKRVRSDTDLGRIAESIGSIAGSFLDHRFGSLEGRTGAIVGAGEAAEDAAKAISAHGARLKVLSRTENSAIQLAAKISAEPHPLSLLQEVLQDCDFAVIAVAGGRMISPGELPQRAPDEPFVVLDLSVPPALEIDGRGDVEIHTLEDLPGPRGPEVTAAVIDAEAMVKKEVAELERWVDTRASGSAIRDLRQQSESIVRDEIRRTLAGMDLTIEQRQKIEMLGTRIANKLLHQPTKELREADEETRHLIMKLFGLEL